MITTSPVRQGEGVNDRTCEGQKKILNSFGRVKFVFQPVSKLEQVFPSWKEGLTLHLILSYVEAGFLKVVLKLKYMACI